MNTVSLIGRLVTTPELKHLQGDKTVTNFTIAVPKKRRNPKTGEYDTNYFRCVAWGKTAELITEHLGKGEQFGLSGELQSSSYQDQTGKRVYSTEIVIREVTFVGGKRNKANAPSTVDNGYSQTENVIEQEQENPGYNPDPYYDDPFSTQQTMGM